MKRLYEIITGWKFISHEKKAWEVLVGKPLTNVSLITSGRK